MCICIIKYAHVLYYICKCKIYYVQHICVCIYFMYNIYNLCMYILNTNTHTLDTCEAPSSHRQPCTPCQCFPCIFSVAVHTRTCTVCVCVCVCARARVSLSVSLSPSLLRALCTHTDKTSAHKLRNKRSNDAQSTRKAKGADSFFFWM
jgi:hypothetical protein